MRKIEPHHVGTKKMRPVVIELAPIIFGTPRFGKAKKLAAKLKTLGF